MAQQALNPCLRNFVSRLILVFPAKRRILGISLRGKNCIDRFLVFMKTDLRHTREIPAPNRGLKVHLYRFVTQVVQTFQSVTIRPNNSRFGYLLGISSLIASAESTMSDPVAETIKKADKLYEEENLEETYKVLLEHEHSGNADILWKLARICRRLSQLPSKSAEDKKNLIYAGLDYAEKAVAADSNNYQCQKWNGIMLSEVGDFEGTKKKIENAYVIKEHFEKAIEICPTDSTSRYLMGRWCYSSAELPWYQRKIAEAIFGSPPKSSYEEALTHFEKAEELSPGFYSCNLLMIAKCYIQLKEKSKARLWLEKLAEFEVVTEDDRQAVKEGAALLT